MFDLIKSDMLRYKKNKKSCFRRLSFWVILTYRYGHWVTTSPYKIVRGVLKIPYIVVVVIWRFFRGVSIPPSARIGGGLLVFHSRLILMPSDTEIGNHCTLHHDITLGNGPIPGHPKIGNNVILFAGCKILGGVTIGDDVTIGANVVVVRDVPSQTIVPPPIARSIPIRSLTIQ